MSEASDARGATDGAQAPPTAVAWAGPVVDGQVTVALRGGATLQVAAGVWRRLALSAGDDVGPGVLAELRAGEEAARAVRAALGLLHARARTRGGLALALARRFPPEAVAAALEETARWCEDDGVFARRWLAARQEHRPAGPAALVAGLVRQGLPPAEARRQVDAWLLSHDRRDEALRCARQLAGGAARTPAGGEPARIARRLWGSLARRGFDEASIAYAVRSLFGEAADGPADDGAP